LSPVVPPRPALERDPALDFGQDAQDLPVISNANIDAALYG